MKKRINNLIALALLATVGLWTVSCSTEQEDPIAEPIASFEFEVSTENTLSVAFTDQSKDADTYAWDFGDNSGTSTEANPVYTYSAGGTYEVTLTVTNAGGTDESTKSVTVTDPAAENLIANPEFDDESAWTLLQLWTAADNAVEHGIVDGEMMFANAEGTVYSQSVFFQPVELEAGATYKFSADVRGDGITNGWFELYFTDFMPEAGLDEATLGDMQLFLKGYGENENCASSEFSGEIFEVMANGCPLPANTSFNADGTFTVSADDLNENNEMYLVFKVGTWDGNFGSGVYMDNVSLVKVD